MANQTTKNTQIRTAELTVKSIEKMRTGSKIESDHSNPAYLARSVADNVRVGDVLTVEYTMDQRGDSKFARITKVIKRVAASRGGSASQKARQATRTVESATKMRTGWRLGLGYEADAYLPYSVYKAEVKVGSKMSIEYSMDKSGDSPFARISRVLKVAA